MGEPLRSIHLKLLYGYAEVVKHLEFHAQGGGFQE